MRRGLRAAAAVVIAAAAAWLVVHVCYYPWICNNEKATAHRTLERLYAHSDEVTARIAARRVIETMDRCIATNPADVGQSMIRGAALRMLGRPGEAADEYRRALRYDRRPELYLNLGLSHLESGNEDAAVNQLVLASLTFRPYLFDLTGSVHDRVAAVVDPLLAEIEAKRVKPERLRDLSHSLASSSR